MRSERKEMTLNLDIIGKKITSVPFSYDEDKVILYALGIGAGVEELDFVYEKNLKVFPTFGVIPFIKIFLSSIVPEAKLNLYSVLHVEHKIVLYRTIPTYGTIYTTTRCDSIYDKRDKGAIINLSSETSDENGEMLFENKAVILDKSAGNFGGEKGPSSEIFPHLEGQLRNFKVKYATSPEQCALYRLSGDKNPLHIDPEFARKAGLNHPILHGLCTFGFAGRAILHNLCDSDPSRFKSFSARFVGVVYPGDKLITEAWETDIGSYIIHTRTQDGRTVLGNAVAEVSCR